MRTGSNRGGGRGVGVGKGGVGGRRGRIPFSHLQNSAGGTEERIPPLHIVLLYSGRRELLDKVRKKEERDIKKCEIEVSVGRWKKRHEKGVKEG